MKKDQIKRQRSLKQTNGANKVIKAWHTDLESMTTLNTSEGLYQLQSPHIQASNLSQDGGPQQLYAALPAENRNARLVLTSL